MYTIGLCNILWIWPGQAAMSVALPIASFLATRSHGFLRVTQTCCVST